MKKMIFLVAALGLLGLTSCKPAAITNAKAFDEKWTPRYGSIVAYWNMDKVMTNNNAPFLSERGSTGTVINPSGGGMAQVTGVVNNAVFFDGVQDHMRIPYASNLNGYQFTISAWVLPTQGTGLMRTILASDSVGPTQGYSLSINAAGQAEVQVGLGNNNWGTAITSGALNVGAWNHVAATYDGVKVSIYLDGALESELVTAYEPNGSRPLYIGAGHTELDPGGMDFFNGALDEIAIWSTALVASDIESIYQKQVPKQ